MPDRAFDFSFGVVRPYAPSAADASPFATAWVAEFQHVGSLGHMSNEERLEDWGDGLLLGRLLGKAEL